MKTTLKRRIKHALFEKLLGPVEKPLIKQYHVRGRGSVANAELKL